MSHYDTLGVPKSADAATIKRAYRKKSREHHPDRPHGNTKAMVAVNRAYDTLRDPQKRAHYDRFGEDRPATPPLDEVARNIIVQVFMQLSERASDQDDIVKLTREQIRDDKRQIAAIAAQTKEKIAKLAKRRKRLKFRGKEGNFLDEMLAREIERLEDQVAKVKERIKVGDRALELLRDFEYEVEQVKAATAEEIGLYAPIFKMFGDYFQS